MKILRVLLAVSILAVVSGCIKVDQTLTISADGSGTLDMSYSMSEQTVMQMESMAKMQTSQTEGEEDNSFDFDEKSVREGLEKFKKDGIEVKDVSTVTKDGWKTMNVKLAFKSLKGLSKTELFKENTISIKKNEAGNYLFIQKSKKENSGPMGDGEMSPEMIQQMAPMFAGMRIVQRIKVPGKIIKSNATGTKDSTASWIFDVDKDPTVLSKIQSLNMEIEFDGKGLDLSDMAF